jgi:glycosyltransferase involved in cell wall biosynthesis
MARERKWLIMAGLRVASVIYDSYPYEIRVRRMAEAAVDAGHEMDVICLRQPGEAPREIHNGVSIYRLPISRGFGRPLVMTALGWVWFTLAVGVYLAWLMPRRRYQVVHVHNIPDFLVFSALIPKTFGARVILDVQDVTPELLSAKAGGGERSLLRRLAEFQERLSIRFAHLVVTVGWPFERKLLERGAPQDKLRIIINSADPKLFPTPKRFSPDAALRPVMAPHDTSAPFIIMYWGTIAPRNGLATAIRALALARREAPTLRLDIMGSDEELPRLRALAEAEGVGDAVHFFEPVAAEHIVDFIVHGDVGVIPYRADGFADLVLPTKAYEMAWLGRPIVASDTGAIRSMFRPESMALCAPDDPNDFARAFVELYQQPEKRRAMVVSATEDYEPYRWEREATRYASLLAWLASAPRDVLQFKPEVA